MAITKVDIEVVAVTTIHTGSVSQSDQPNIEFSLRLIVDGVPRKGLLKFTEMASNLAGKTDQELETWKLETFKAYVKTVINAEEVVSAVTGDWSKAASVQGEVFSINRVSDVISKVTDQAAIDAIKNNTATNEEK